MTIRSRLRRIGLLVGAAALFVHCGTPPSRGISTAPVAPRRAASPRVEPPLDPSYRQLDPAFHYFAVSNIEPTSDHYLVTFHDIEGAYCELRVEPDGQVQGGCGFPSDGLRKTTIPRHLEHQRPALEAAVKRDHPNARGLELEYRGHYARVFLDEARPCAPKRDGTMVHGVAYSRVAVRLAASNQIEGVRLERGSGCGALPFYWAAPHPRWLPLRTTISLLPLEGGELHLTRELAGALLRVLADPDGSWPVPSEPPPDANDGR